MLQTLLDESVSVRDLVRIYEALSLRAQATKDLDQLVEAARNALGPAIISPHLVDGTVHVISFEPQLEQRMLEGMRQGDQGAMIAIDPVTGQQMLTQLAQFTTDSENQNIRPVLVCAPQLRAAIRRMVRPALPALAVVSYTELTGANQVRSVGVVSGERAGGDRMIPLSGGVLFAAAIVASPALWLSLVEQTMPIDVALTRYFIVLAIAWVGLSILVDLTTPGTTVRVESEEQPERAGEPTRHVTAAAADGAQASVGTRQLRQVPCGCDALEGHLATELLGATAQVAQPALADLLGHALAVVGDAEQQPVAVDLDLDQAGAGPRRGGRSSRAPRGRPPAAGRRAVRLTRESSAPITLICGVKPRVSAYSRIRLLRSARGVGVVAVLELVDRGADVADRLVELLDGGVDPVLALGASG